MINLSLRLKNPIRRDECLNNAFSWEVFMFLVGCLGLLCVLGAAKACDSDENKPIRDYCFGGVDRWFFACSNSALKISWVIGLRCLAMYSSFSLTTIILVHIFVRFDRSAGGSKLQSLNSMLMDSMYPLTVADRELWLSMSCSMKHVMILWYPGLLPQGSWMLCFFAKFRYTACLNLGVSISESVLSLDNFLSTIFPRADRLACNSAGRNCRLSALCAPAEGWRSSRYHEKGMIWSQVMLVFSAFKSCLQFFWPC